MADHSGTTREVAAQVAAYFATWAELRCESLRLPGLQVAVLHEDEVLLSSAYGLADVEANVPLRSDTLFRIASHSKMYTATAVMQLVEQRKLRLDDPVSRWISDLADSPVAAVTVRELLAHGAGVIRDGVDADYWQLAKPFPDAAELVSIFSRSDAATYPRNDVYKYSNVGYALLGAIVAAASGEAYNDYVRRHIVDVLGLHRTGPEFDPARAADYAACYTSPMLGLPTFPIEHVDTGVLSSAAGFYSTAEDLCRFMSAHVPDDERLLNDDAKRLMQREEWQIDGEESHYGLGFELLTVGDRKLIGHGGGFPGHTSRTWLDPVDRFAVSVATNVISGPVGPLSVGAVQLLNFALSHTGGNTSGAANTDAICGRYANLCWVIDVVQLGRRLFALIPDQPNPVGDAVELVPDGEHRYRMGKSSGFLSHGEPMTFEVVEGVCRSVRADGAMTMYPVDAYRERMLATRGVAVGASPIGDQPVGP